MIKEFNKIQKLFAWFRIPKGQYCSRCPYYRSNIAPIKMGDGYMAYCRYLNMTDLDIIKQFQNKDNSYTIKGTKGGNPFEVDLDESEIILIGVGSLLWDGCKECGIKDE